MNPRLRSRETWSAIVNTINTKGVDEARDRVVETFFESNYPGSNECKHIKISGQSGPILTYDTQYDRSGLPAQISIVQGSAYWLMSPVDLEAVIRPWIPPQALNWSKLNTSSDFGFLQAIAEFDDSIALFTRRFWSQMTAGGLYGTWTWGVVPFWNDLKALAEQGKNLLNRNPNNRQSYEEETVTTIKQTVPFPTSVSGVWTCTLDLEVKSRHSGIIEIPQAPFLEAFDRLGFHPDIATAWDLVPLSFVADYILPIGEALEGISDRGWIKAVNFSGWHTIHVKGTVKGLRREHGHGSADWDEFQEVEFFYRSRLSHSVLLDQQYEGPDRFFELPSPRQFFNTLYLGLTRRRR